MGSTQLEERVLPRLDDGDHERFAHYVRRADSVRSVVEGTPIRALCGKKWIPSRDPDRFPICPACKEMLAARVGSS